MIKKSKFNPNNVFYQFLKEFVGRIITSGGPRVIREPRF